MTDCEQALREIEAYLDGELASDSIVQLEVHLEDCPPCSGRADFQRRLKVLIAGKCAGPSQVPASLRARIDAILHPDPAAD